MPALLSYGLDKLLFRSLINGLEQLNAKSNEITRWRIDSEKKIEGKDLFSALLEASDPETGNHFTQKELVSEVGLFIVGGTDTTITGTSATLFYILHDPDVYQRLQEEVRGTFVEEEEILIGPKLTSCKLLMGCIQESMRLSPPVPSLLPREVLGGGILVEGELFPQGVDISVPHYAMHHDPEYYPEPFAFKPERFIDQGQAGAQAAFCAFGVGRTSCIGKYLAYQEMQLILARLLWRFDMRILPGSKLGEGSGRTGSLRSRESEFQLYDRFVSMHKGPLVQFRMRSDTRK